MTRWLNCGVVSQVSWPKTKKIVEYGGSQFHLHPMTKDLSASVHIELNGMNQVQGMTVINRFLSALSWKNDQPTITHNGFSGSAIPRPIPIYQVPLMFAPTSSFPNAVFAITDGKAKRAVALYREGLSLNSLCHIPFSFLSFFKVLNVFWNDRVNNVPNPNDKKKPLRKNSIVDGIRVELPDLKDNESQARIAEIRKVHSDVALYLYKDGRCAVAHAFSGAIVDPDDGTDIYRLGKDLWLMRRLAAHVIEKQCGITQSLFA